MRIPRRKPFDIEWGYSPDKQWSRMYRRMLIQNSVRPPGTSSGGEAAQLREAMRGVQTQVVLQIYNELVYVGPEAEAEAVKTLMEEEPRAAPPWMPELPLTAEVKVKRSWGTAK